MFSKTKKVTPGWQWSVHTGYRTNNQGTPIRGTDEKIIKGWEPTPKRAKEAAEKKMRELKAEKQETTSEQLFG